LDAVKDSVYDDSAHAFIISTPHQVSPSNYETIYWFRNDTHLIGYADGFDADSLSNDDSFKLGVDNTGNGLTTDDRQFILTEGGSVSAKRWSGSAWLPQSTSAEGIVVGSGGGGAIQYEMIIPLSEMSGFVDGVTAKFMMERKCTSLNPDVSTYFPETLINDTDGTLWATAELTIGDEYVYVGNSTTSDYNVENLTAFTWYKHNITAVNGVDESAGAFSTDITLDYPKYTVSGYIKDITGTPIPNATVWSQNGIVTEHDTSNATGYYSGEHFHNGTYRIFANATGYATNNTTAFTVAGANITNKNVTLIESVSDNLVNFTFTNLAYTTPIKEYESSTITVDINDSDGTITSAIIKIHDNNYTMQYISGDQWRYIYSSGIITNHYITDIYATDNSSGMNTTSYTTDYISILSRAGAGGGGGIVLPPQDEEEPDVVEITIPTNVSDAVDFVENITKGIGNIISGDSFSMLRINTNPFQPSYAKTIMISGVVDVTSTDPNVDVGAVNNEVIVITRPPLDNSLYFKYDTSIDIVLDTGVIEHRDYSVLVID
ncbi:MAG: carboxypeptidase regulatory-like domain-containing protein, partial [Alphaproteobacteria bacterium]|nr:carboxypeptidase regulatory-like domain-containing protein [Alphaproteobacteria bacterium]